MNAIVIGAGIGGLCAAIRLAARGMKVEVFEAGPRPGGKADVVVVDGVECDTGPSVLTLPDVFDEVFRSAGTSLRAEVELLTPDPAFLYVWPGGPSLKVHHHPDQTLASVRDTLGVRAADELRRFLNYAKGIWDVSAPRFVQGPAPNLTDMFSPAALSDVLKIDAMRSMKSAVAGQVSDPHLRMLLARYATYNGSDYRRAPATLNCIAHVELTLGGYGVEGGIYALVRALVRAASRLGVQFNYNSPVQSLLHFGARVTGVSVDGADRIANVVVANADATAVRDLLAPPAIRSAMPARLEPSMSGWNALLRAKDEARRAAHTVLFPADYEDEFADIFDRKRPPQNPTVYLCAQSTCHRRARWEDAEPVFVMANAPAGWQGDTRPLRTAVLAQAAAAGLIRADDAVLWERSPADLASRFPGTAGALYGASSNGRAAAFQRPANRVRGAPGLYLASGSAHPGGGLPLCARSGINAAIAALDDHP